MSANPLTGRSEGSCDEESPLLEHIKSHHEQDPKPWYEYGHEAIGNWKKHNLSTYQVLFTLAGTIFVNSTLWVEQLVTVGIFTCICSAIAIYPPPNYSEWMDSTEGNIRSFTTLLAGLAGFLLTFYVSLCINRWWNLRINGVGNIWNACSELSLYIAQTTTRERHVLESIRRYTRASLLLVYMENHQITDKLHRITNSGILDEGEVQALMCFQHPAECIWTWILEIIVMLHEEGKIKSEPFYCFLLQKCNDGRVGVASISSYLSTPTPIIYVHLLCLMVKLHNLFLAILMGMLAADHLSQRRMFLLMQVMGRIFLMPLLYNAILLVCEQLSNPFSGDIGGFPLEDYLKGMDDKSKNYLRAGHNLPKWLRELKDKRRQPEGP